MAIAHLHPGFKDDKDRMEAEVGLLIKACAQQIEQVRTCFAFPSADCSTIYIDQACAQLIKQVRTW